MSSAETATLDGIADEATIHFPWGSLLDAVLGERPDVLAAAACPLKCGGSLRILVSAVERDGRDELSASRLEALRSAYAAAGLEMREVRDATRSDIDEAHSSWGKRLGAGRTRPAYVVRCVRRAVGAASLLVAANGGPPDERARPTHR